MKKLFLINLIISFSLIEPGLSQETDEILSFRETIKYFQNDGWGSIPEPTLQYYFNFQPPGENEEMIRELSLGLTGENYAGFYFSEGYYDTSPIVWLQMYNLEGSLLESFEFSREEGGDFYSSSVSSEFINNLEIIRRTSELESGLEEVWDEEGNMVGTHYKTYRFDYYVEIFYITEDGYIIPGEFTFTDLISLLENNEKDKIEDIPTGLYDQYLGTRPVKLSDQAITIEVSLHTENYVGIMISEISLEENSEVYSHAKLTTYTWEGNTIDYLDFTLMEISETSTRTIDSYFYGEPLSIIRNHHESEGSMEITYDENGDPAGENFIVSREEDFTEKFKITDDGYFELLPETEEE